MKIKIKKNKKAKQINLLPKEYIQAEQAKLIRITVQILLFIETCLFIVIIVIPPKLEAGRLHKELDSVITQTKASKFKDVNITIEELEMAKRDVKGWVDKYGSIKEENVISARVLDSLTSRVPVGVNISSIFITSEQDGGAKGTIGMSLTSSSLNSLYSYMNIIESMYGRGRTVLNSSRDATTGECFGDLTIKIPLDTNVLMDSQGEDGQDIGVDEVSELNEGGNN